MQRFVTGLIDNEADRDAEDIIQDVMLNIFSATDVTRPIQNLSSYVYGALRNRVIDLLRKRRFDVSIDAPVAGEEGVSLADILSDARYDTVSDFEKDEIRQRIMEAIATLKEDEQMIIIMTDFEGRSFREISENTGEPVGTLLSRKSRAIKKIEKKLAYLFKE